MDASGNLNYYLRMYTMHTLIPKLQSLLMIMIWNLNKSPKVQLDVAHFFLV